MLIRILLIEDALALRECRLLGLRESPEAFLVTHEEVSAAPLSTFEAELASEDIHYVGAFEGAELVGFMRYIRFPRAARRHVAEVRSVHVMNSARGRGIGTRLLRQLIEDAKAAGIESLVLAVLEDNTVARRLYESCGFQLYGIEPRAVRRGRACVAQALYSLQLVHD